MQLAYFLLDTPCSRTLVIFPSWGVTLNVYQVDMEAVYQIFTPVDISWESDTDLRTVEQ